VSGKPGQRHLPLILRTSQMSEDSLASVAVFFARFDSFYRHWQNDRTAAIVGHETTTGQTRSLTIPQSSRDPGCRSKQSRQSALL
jgi:hypothetical protein